ncbi:phytanoyl-CoA dioxygenase family protein [Phenylobacterium sp.]|jgi:ectoine hydroxylase-related dioxygenase (phytanoyl-CoA dioxygenase family)|uniref:phytanoyl-CoA dioxygenase family protein n=1 Tax=Phenylobacterium sp. TaxID=1871053 RepID=UPI0035B02528
MSQNAVSARPSATMRRLPFGAPAEEVAAVVELEGGVILTAALSAAEVAAINADLDREFDRLAGGNFSDGGQTFVGDFMGHKTKRLAHCVKYSRTLREAFYDAPIIREYLAAMMPGPAGSHTMYASHGIEIYPGERPQELHRDGGGLMEVLGVGGPGGPNLQVNFLLALTDVTEEMGATRVIPGSNHWESYETPGEQSQTIPATMFPGDVLCISGKVLHGGGANVTKDRRRRVLSTAFSPGIILGEEAWPHVITADEARTYPQRLQSYLGFRSISYKGEQPGFLWRAHTRPLEEHLAL